MSTRLDPRSLLTMLALLIAATAAAQVRPSVLTSATPYGLQRGTTVTLVVDGANLEGATEVLFSDAGLTGSIDRYEDLGADIRERQPGETGAVIQDKATKGRLAITVTAAGTVPAGRHGFRVRTPLGTTSFMPLWVGEDPEAREAEPNDDLAQSQALTAPVTVNGWLGMLEDVDVYRVRARGGRDLVLKITASPLGSNADAAIAVLDERGETIAVNDDFGIARDPLLVYRPDRDRQQPGRRRPPPLPADPRRGSRRDVGVPAGPAGQRRRRAEGDRRQPWRLSSRARRCAVARAALRRPGRRTGTRARARGAT
jgi:hypothetical protein